jgi:folate-binding protein YgfZ
MNDDMFGRLQVDCELFATAAPFSLLSGRTQIEVRGNDRASFLHGMCTNDVKKLTSGKGCEAFFTNVQGKTIGHGYLLASDDAITIDTTPDQAAVLIPALDRYIIREQVELVDRTAERSVFLVAGATARGLLRQLLGSEPPAERLDHIAATLAGSSVTVRRVDFVSGDCYFVACDINDANPVQAALDAAGAPRIGDDAVDAARIEQGTPLFGRDITPTNLPQELARDALAINFNKGCYLGQETVARIDALGHVNRYLCGVKFEGDQIPAVGTQLRAGDKQVGEVTSITFSPTLKSPLALAFVRRGHHAPGTKLESDAGPAEVVRLPIQ